MIFKNFLRAAIMSALPVIKPDRLPKAVVAAAADSILKPRSLRFTYT